MKDEREALKSVLRARTIGFGELLATALGNPASISKTLSGLSAEALAKGHHGAAISPSLVSYRVDAIAAWDPQLVRSVARGWRPIAALTIDESLDADYWLAAWSAAVRFLPRDELDEQELANAPYMIRREAEALLGPPPFPEVSLVELLSLQGAADAYLVYRQLDRSKFLGEVTASDLAVAFKPDRAMSWEPLRALRAHHRVFTRDARRFVLDLFEREWSKLVASSDASESIGPNDLVCLADVVRVLDPSVFARIPMPPTDRPIDMEQWAPLLYSVFMTRWTTP